MAFVEATARLTDEGLSAMLAAAVAAAKAMGQPQCIVVVDQSGVTLAAFRMAGSRYLSLKSATAKARTAASIGAPSDSVPEPVRPAIAAATEGAVTGFRVGGVLLGGIGVGSGSGEQDETVARAALSAIGADTAGQAA
jgi:uncharacterized protein GlcG (DUF336 family)